jgi:hypothetical protein
MGLWSWCLTSRVGLGDEATKPHRTEAHHGKQPPLVLPEEPGDDLYPPSSATPTVLSRSAIAE